MSNSNEIEYSVHVVKNLYENYLHYTEIGDEFKANYMLKKILEEGQNIVEWSNELLKTKEIK